MMKSALSTSALGDVPSALPQDPSQIHDEFGIGIEEPDPARMFSNGKGYWEIGRASVAICGNMDVRIRGILLKVPMNLRLI